MEDSRLKRLTRIEQQRVNENFARRQERARKEFHAMFARKTCSKCKRDCKAFRFLREEDVVCSRCVEGNNADSGE